MRAGQPDRLSIVGLGIVVEGGLAALAWGLGRLIGRSPWETLRIDLRGAVVGIAATFPLLLAFVWCLRSPLRPLARIRRVVDGLISPLFATCTLLDLALIALAAGIGEEVLFRGLIQAELGRRLGPGLGLTLASLLFGLLHPITPAYVLIASLMGGYLGLIWIVGGNLLVPIVAHALYDFLALVYLLRRRQARGPSPALDSDVPGPSDDRASRPPEGQPSPSESAARPAPPTPPFNDQGR